MERPRQRAVVLDGGVFRDLQDDAVPGHPVEEPRESVRSGGVRRRVHGEIGAGGQPREIVQGQPHRLQLELGEQPHRRGLLEPLIRPQARLGVEPGQGLRADRHPSLQIEDGLVDHVERSAIEHRLDATPAFPVPLVLGSL